MLWHRGRRSGRQGVVRIGLLLLLRIPRALLPLVDVPSVPLGWKEGRKEGRRGLHGILGICEYIIIRMLHWKTSCVRMKLYSSGTAIYCMYCRYVCMYSVCVSYHLLSFRVVHLYRGKRKGL